MHPGHWALLAPLPTELQTRVLAEARRRRFDSDVVVFHEGDSGDTLHLVESGRLTVRVSTESGESVTLRVLRAGDAFGELALMRRPAVHYRTATITTLEPTETLSLSGETFHALRAQHHELDMLMLSLLIERVDQLSHRLLEALYVGVDRRVYRRLVELAEIYGDGDPGTRVPLTQDDLAGMVGATRPTVNQVLQRLAADGTVSLGRRGITIDGVDTLRRRAAGGSG